MGRISSSVYGFEAEHAAEIAVRKGPPLWIVGVIGRCVYTICILTFYTHSNVNLSSMAAVLIIYPPNGFLFVISWPPLCSVTAIQTFLTGTGMYLFLVFYYVSHRNVKNT